MIKKRPPTEVTGDFRVRAEKLQAAGGTGREPILSHDVRELVHELQVHQTELETQNEELRRAQASITESRNRYVDLYDMAPVGYITLDPQGLIGDLNLKGAGLLGAPRKLLIQRPFILFVAPEYRQTFSDYLRRLSDGAAHQSCELELNPQQGPAGAVSLESLAMIETGGKVIQYRMAITDITRRRKAEDDLRRSEEKFRLLYEKAPLGYQSLDEDGIIREVNQAWLDLLGYPRQEVVGRWFGDFLPPGYYERFPERFASPNETGEVCNLDFEMVRKDGARVSVSFYGRVAFDDQGGFVQTHCMFQDVTARKQAEEEIARKRDQLRALASRLAEVEEAERQHLARELHDQVCQSLTALGLTLTLLQIQMPRKAAPALLRRVADALALVEQTGLSIRDLMAELRPPMLDDYGLLSALQWYGEKFFGLTGITVDVQGQEAAPRLAAPVELALFRIVQEAMNNVVKHAQATEVVLTEEVDNHSVRLVIADNGVGFDQERLGQPEGHHLWGLMTISERAMAAGGHCRIESQPGQGTRVVVEVSR
jgi:PAS domain S-box-containing protein